MSRGRIIAVISAAALAGAAIGCAPAIGADSGDYRLPRTTGNMAGVRGIGSFTPAAADPKLAAILSRAGLESTGFRFTPSESRRSGNRAVTVAVRARSSRSAQEAERLATAAPNFGLTPISYNLGVSVGWKRFAISGDVARLDLAGLPGSRETVDVGVSYAGKRFSGRVAAVSDRPIAGAPKLSGDVPTYGVDVAGSYSLTRNLDVTAGVRYRADRDRLELPNDNRRDSQAVYFGTAFRF